MTFGKSLARPLRSGPASLYFFVSSPMKINLVSLAEMLHDSYGYTAKVLSMSTILFDNRNKMKREDGSKPYYDL